MGADQQPALEIRIIKEMEQGFEPSHKLVLKDPYQLEYIWLDIEGDQETIAQNQDRLWERYNPKFQETIGAFNQHTQGGAFINEISDILSLEYSKVRTLKNMAIREYELPKKITEAKGKKVGSRWHSLPIELVAYMLCYQMPMIEGWKTSYDISRENDVSISTINSLCSDPEVEAVVRAKKWYISPLGEKAIPARLRNKGHDTAELSQQKTIEQQRAQIAAYRNRISLQEQQLTGQKARIESLQAAIAVYEKQPAADEPDQDARLKAALAQLKAEKARLPTYQKQIKTLTLRLADAEETIEHQRRTLLEQDKTIAELRARYGAGGKDYFLRLAAQSEIIDQALSSNRPPELHQVIDLLAYLHRASEFQPQVLPPDSDYSPAMEAQGSTGVAPKDIMEWYGRWIETKEQRFASHLADYFLRLTTELQEKFKK